MRLAVLDTSYGDIAVEQSAAAEHGVDVIDARADAAEADGVLVQYASIGAEELDANPNWRVIGRYGVGYDTIDIDAASQRGIPVLNVPDYCEEEVATHAAALILGAVRQVSASEQLVREGRWREWSTLRPIQALSVSTLSLVGIGRIGREVIRLVGPFFGRVVAYDPFSGPVDGVELVELEDALSLGDVVSLHCPLTEQTRHIIDAGAVASMKPTAYLVNVSRGGLVDAAALASALATGAIAGAALDVLESEPPTMDGPDADPLLSAPNVTITNHLAWYSEQSELRLRHLLAERCAAVLVGLDAPSIVNRGALAAREELQP